MNDAGKARGWFRRRRDARVAANLGVRQAEISTLGLDYDGALNRFDDLVAADRVAEAFDFAEQARHSLDAGTRGAGELMMSLLELTQQRLQDAAATLDRALALAGPQAEPDVALRRAQLLLHLDREPEAVEQLQRALENPSTRRMTQAAIALGRMTADQGNDTEAELYLLLAYDSGHAPSVLSAALDLGKLKERAGLPYDARTFYEAAADSTAPSESREARMRLGVLLLNLGDHDRSRALLEELAADEDLETATMAAINLAALHRERREWPDAIRWLTLATKSPIPHLSLMANQLLTEAQASN
ncbi:tetratricopeptide repeat protein [Kribbella sp. NPDC059898]|uniref:tetratricopeptide repeat protein n=1 Tax=Kribbella sp. NPDC059898 TaxID=3346995 RepID=UPI003646121E